MSKAHQAGEVAARWYVQLRAELEVLMAQPVKDMPRIDQLVDALERAQLEVKSEMGLEGNNPKG